MNDIKFDPAKIKHHKIIQDLSDLLAVQTNNIGEEAFFRQIVMFYLGVMASSMRTTIKTQTAGTNIPANIFTVAFATSGFGKDHSSKILHDHIIDLFKIEFNRFYNMVALEKIALNAHVSAIQLGVDENTLYKQYVHDFNQLGTKIFIFDAATTPAIKQARNKDLIAECGSINFKINEFGSKFTEEMDAITTFLELYDGTVSQKLVKNTSENKRTADLTGLTPANLLFMGTPDALYDSNLEKAFAKLLEIGYARRCLFALANKKPELKETAASLFKKLSQTNSSSILDHYKKYFLSFININFYNINIELQDQENILLLDYKLYNQSKIKNDLNIFNKLEATELANKDFKVLKIAAILAYFDKSYKITKEHIYNGIALCEESSIAFDKFLNREPNHAVLAQFIAAQNEPVTHAFLHKKLAFFKESSYKRKELLDLAKDWAFNNNIIIKTETRNNIELISGEKLQETNIDSLNFSLSTHYADNYEPVTIAFDKLTDLTHRSDLHFCVHSFKDNHRDNNKVIPGFNVLVLDIDGTCKLKFMKYFLGNYSYFIYTTKSHQIAKLNSATGEEEVKDRYRIILPLKYKLNLTKDEYKEFVNNIFDFLPFTSDTGANEIARKWQTNQGQTFFNTGELFDPLRFIPNTSNNIQFKKSIQDIKNLNKLEKYFYTEIEKDGNRNNNILRYACVLLDNKCSFVDIEKRVLDFNSNLKQPLDRTELYATVLKTIANKINKGV